MIPALEGEVVCMSWMGWRVIGGSWGKACEGLDQWSRFKAGILGAYARVVFLAGRLVFWTLLIAAETPRVTVVPATSS